MQPMLSWYWSGAGFMTITDDKECEGFKVIECVGNKFSSFRWNHWKAYDSGGCYEFLGGFDTLREAVEAVGDQLLKDVKEAEASETT